jgi:integrase
VRGKGAKLKRAYGSGSLSVYTSPTGAETWVGRWRHDGKPYTERVGPKRKPGTKEGLTRTAAEAELRRLMGETPKRLGEARARVTIAEAGAQHIDRLEALGRKSSTVSEYRGFVRVHLAPYFENKPLRKITPADIEAFMAHKIREGKAVKSVLNYVGLLHGIFEFAVKQGWVDSNPCQRVEKPKRNTGDPIKRFLDLPELEALLRSVAQADSPMAATDRLIYLTAATAGLREGEIFGLRWRDIDWLAEKIRVRQSYVKGQWTTPKSRRSTRAVPLGTRLARELEAHYQRSLFQGDDELVFCHPSRGTPLEASALLKRFKRAMKRAGLRPARVHDLRHTFGTQMAAQGVPMRTLQEWMGHRDFKTTLIYADYAPGADEKRFVDAAFGDLGESSPHGEEAPISS